MTEKDLEERNVTATKSSTHIIIIASVVGVFILGSGGYYLYSRKKNLNSEI